MKGKQRNAGLLIFLILLVTLGILSGCSKNDPIVATVNGENIMQSEFNEMFNSFKTQYEAQFGPDVWEQEMDGVKFITMARDKILDVEIGYRLEAAKAKELGITVTEAELDAEVADAEAYFGSKEGFNEFLKEQQLTLQSFRDGMQKQLLNSKLREKINEGTVVSDEEVKAFYESHKEDFNLASASHILVATREEAEQARARVKAGEDFATVAKEVSTDPSAQTNGGDLGSFRFADMVEPFAQAAFSMKAGEVSEPVETQFGFHIILSNGVSQQSLTEAQESIRADLLSTRRNEVYTAMMNELMSNADIKKFPENL